jgi:hypothetical protein
MTITYETDRKTGRAYYLATVRNATTGRKILIEADTRPVAMALAYMTESTAWEHVQ